ncbi:zinc ribbon domain-containing protein [Desulfovibrio sp. OttesenSCG-928-G15]|nr:zinc ribbon domain-containing protein [Desulfovibrio sp. OttesenSCG-928-G15]
MPIYEYRCEECKQLFEEWCKHVEDESTPHACPICKGHAERIISHTSFALKGGGWYVTEYGSRKSDGAGAGVATASAHSANSTKTGAVEGASSAAPTVGNCMGASCSASGGAGASTGSGPASS